MIVCMVGNIGQDGRLENPCYKWRVCPIQKPASDDRVATSSITGRIIRGRFSGLGLRDRIGFDPSWRVADIGSGTGISTRMFLENGNQVTAIEPNADMRTAAERMLENQPRFRSVDASAEQTTLADASVDLIVSAQAFHWFDLAKCKIEFARILKPNGWCA